MTGNRNLQTLGHDASFKWDDPRRWDPSFYVSGGPLFTGVPFWMGPNLPMIEGGLVALDPKAILSKLLMTPGGHGLLQFLLPGAPQSVAAYSSPPSRNVTGESDA